MDTDTKRFLGSLLGEIYRLQRRTDATMCGLSDATLYGLLNGFEHVIDEQLELVGFVSRDQVDAASKVLDQYWSDPARLAAFKGFYDIEKELEAVGIDRMQAIKIITLFRADGQFQDLIAKMDSSNSPSECRKFPLREHDK